MSNALVLTNLLLGLLDRQAQVATLLNKAAAEGRDVSSAELDVLFADDAAARSQLHAAIVAAKGV